MEKEILTFIETKFETGTDAKQIKNCRNFALYLDSFCIRLTIKSAMSLLNKSPKLKDMASVVDKITQTHYCSAHGVALLSVVGVPLHQLQGLR